MALRFAVAAVAADTRIRQALDQCDRVRVGCVQQAAPYVVAALCEGGPTLVVTASDKAADALAEALGDFIDPAGIAVFPAWETLPHERLSPSGDTIGARMAVLRRLAHPGEGAPIQIGGAHV